MPDTLIKTDQPKPIGLNDYRPQDLDDGDTGVSRSEENYDPPPKPTGEWTVEKADAKYAYIVEKVSRKQITWVAMLLPTANVVCAAHNAALAVAEQKYESAIAAAQQPLVALLEDMKKLEPKFAIFIDAALARVKEDVK